MEGAGGLPSLLYTWYLGMCGGAMVCVVSAAEVAVPVGEPAHDHGAVITGPVPVPRLCPRGGVDTAKLRGMNKSTVLCPRCVENVASGGARIRHAH